MEADEAGTLERLKVNRSRIFGSAMGYAVTALAALGEVERAKEWAGRATLLDPENLNMRYNFACTLVIE